MDLATLIKPVLTAGELRVVGSTTFEEFKQIEKDRALARRLQKVVVEEPSVEETVRILQGLRARYEEHHQVEYSDAAIEVAAKLAKRHLRDYRLPDSAIDILDEAGAMLRLQSSAPADAAAVPVGVAPEPAAPRPAVTPAEIERVVGPHGAHPRQAGDRLRQGAAAHARGIAPPRGVRPGRGGARGDAGDQALARRPRRSPTGRPGASSSPARPASARRSWPSSSRCTSATSSCATT